MDSCFCQALPSPTKESRISEQPIGVIEDITDQVLDEAGTDGGGDGETSYKLPNKQSVQSAEGLECNRTGFSDKEANSETISQSSCRLHLLEAEEGKGSPSVCECQTGEQNKKNHINQAKDETSTTSQKENTPNIANKTATDPGVR